jgi:hypothetical protein
MYSALNPSAGTLLHPTSWNQGTAYFNLLGQVGVSRGFGGVGFPKLLFTFRSIFVGVSASASVRDESSIGCRRNGSQSCWEAG